MNNLADIIAPNLVILFIGYNPGLRSAETGHHFAGRSNLFWKLLAQAGLTPRQFKPEEDRSLIRLGMGITNIVERPSRTAEELSREEYATGRKILMQKLSFYKPAIACYAGIGVYRAFARMPVVKCGLQLQNAVEGVTDYVVPSPSGLTRIPFDEQLGYYLKLKGLATAYQK